MCIIAIKEAVKEFPSIETFRTMYNSNPDGFGYMFADGLSVHIKKGFTDFKKAEKEYKKIMGMVKFPFVLHFRIGTHGLRNDPRLTHPFPLGVSKKEEFLLLENSVNIGFAHNGIISTMPDHKVYSDSIIYGKRILSPLAEKWNSFIGNGAESIISSTLGSSRLAILWKSGAIEYFGTGWNKDEKGILYSNDSWKKSIFSDSWYNFPDFSDDDAFPDFSPSYNSPECFPVSSIPTGFRVIKKGETWHGEIYGEIDGKEFHGEFGRIGKSLYELDGEYWDLVDSLLK